MKTIKILSLFAFASIFFTACSSDDDVPEVVNEEEVITTMTVTLVPETGSTIILQTQDLDGDGPDDPVITVSGNLAADTEYSGTIVLLNETEDPVENITEEIEEEADEHQFFFDITGSISSVTYDDEDGNGYPVGLEFTLTTGSAGSGTLTITLKHQPTKPNDGTIADAGGETDITQSFTVTVE